MDDLERRVRLRARLSAPSEYTRPTTPPRCLDASATTRAPTLRRHTETGRVIPIACMGIKTGRSRARGGLARRNRPIWLPKFGLGILRGDPLFPRPMWVAESDAFQSPEHPLARDHPEQIPMPAMGIIANPADAGAPTRRRRPVGLGSARVPRTSPRRLRAACWTATPRSRLPPSVRGGARHPRVASGPLDSDPRSRLPPSVAHASPPRRDPLPDCGRRCSSSRWSRRPTDSR